MSENKTTKNKINPSKTTENGKTSTKKKATNENEKSLQVEQPVEEKQPVTDKVTEQKTEVKKQTTKKKTVEIVEPKVEITQEATITTDNTKTKKNKQEIEKPEDLKIEETQETSIKTKKQAKEETAQTETDSYLDEKKKVFFKNKKEVAEVEVERFKPTCDKGLTTEQVALRMEQGQFNDTSKKYSKSYKSIFLGNLCTFFNLLCVICAVLLIISGAAFNQLLFIIIFAFNLIIGIAQEIKAKKKIEKLSLLTSPTALVVRNGEEKEIPLNEIVLDDIIILKTGQQVPADCILKEGYVEVNESLLTGESVPIKKDKNDKLLCGSFISSGTCKVQANKIGKHTYLQSLSARASKYKKPNSELLNATKNIIRIVGILIPLICAGMFYVNWTQWQGAFDSGATTLTQMNYSIQYTASIAIGMIPSGMMLLTSLALAVGVIKLTKYNTLVQDLYSLEMLARVNVLCLDKTGTITDGRMQVNCCIPTNGSKQHDIDKIVASLLWAVNDNNQTAIALYNHFGHNNTYKAKTILPFSSKRKLSAVTFQNRGTYVLGAPEFVIPHLPKEVADVVNEHAAQGLRVLIVAHSPNEITGEDTLPNDLQTICIITLMDNIREDAVSTIKWFKENDVEIKIISGDNPITVSEVARRVGVKNADKFVSLEGLNEKEVANIANKYTVFGRVTPEQKAILVKAIKREGNTVAMTGDGVNDILALKESDCAISVASGSEAARNVSNLVLMDNNFNSMPMVVNEGRRVINNVKKSSSLFLMKTIFVALLAIYSICLQKSYPFTTGNMLLLEFFVIGLPSFFLSLQPNTDRVSGNFISYVLSRAIPGGLILFYGLTCVNVAEFIAPEIFAQCATQLGVIAVSFCGLVMLYRFCQPVNVSRAVLLSISTLTCLTVIILESVLSDKFSLLFNVGEWVTLGWALICFEICIIQLAVPLSRWMIWIIEKIGVVISKRKQKSNGKVETASIVDSTQAETKTASN